MATGKERMEALSLARWNYEASAPVGRSEENARYAREMDALTTEIASDLDTLARIRKAAGPVRDWLRLTSDSWDESHPCAEVAELLRAIDGEAE